MNSHLRPKAMLIYIHTGHNLEQRHGSCERCDILFDLLWRCLVSIFDVLNYGLTMLPVLCSIPGALSMMLANRGTQCGRRNPSARFVGYVRRRTPPCHDLHIPGLYQIVSKKNTFDAHWRTIMITLDGPEHEPSARRFILPACGVYMW